MSKIMSYYIIQKRFSIVWIERKRTQFIDQQPKKYGETIVGFMIHFIPELEQKNNIITIMTPLAKWLKPPYSNKKKMEEKHHKEQSTTLMCYLNRRAKDAAIKLQTANICLSHIYRVYVNKLS